MRAMNFCVAGETAGSGILIRPGEVSELVKAIEGLLDSPERAAKLSSQGIRQAEYLYDKEKDDRQNTGDIPESGVRQLSADTSAVRTGMISRILRVLRVTRPSHILKAMVNPRRTLRAAKYHYWRVSEREFIEFFVSQGNVSKEVMDELYESWRKHEKFRDALQINCRSIRIIMDYR